MIDRVDLSDNTNLWGAPPAASRVLSDVWPSRVSHYPEPFSKALKQALSHYVGVAPRNIATGCGSDDVLDAAMRTLAEPGEAIAMPAPTFTMIPIFARLNRLHLTSIPLTSDCDVDLDHTLGAGAQLVYLCSPNNPTGRTFSRDRIERIVRNATGVVIVDEAYAEFTDWSALELMGDAPRLLVTRTLSKAFGLAGLRVGYAVGSPALIARIEKARPPYRVNSLAEAAAVRAVTDDLEWVRARVADMKVCRARFTAALRKLGLKPLQSDANFVLLPVASSASQLAKRLRARGVVVRAFTALDVIGDAIRITIGPWEMMERCLLALRAELDMKEPSVVPA